MKVYKEPDFPAAYAEILKRIDEVDPVAYGPSRNYIDGAVSYLSPYISRGVISTEMVFSKMKERAYEPREMDKLVQELAWRDYWQQVWIAKGDEINSDLKHKQEPVTNTQISKELIEAKTGIEAIDKAITTLYQTGYLHNHLRMYIASVACNVRKSHWKVPAQWMYYHLLDADWASNALSWQWVAGANSSKQYFANQENINEYCHTNQKGTFLDIPYETINEVESPQILHDLVSPELITPLPQKKTIEVDQQLPTYIYNLYNLDPLWSKGIEANRILLLEPSLFKQYPISQKSIDFTLELGKNIDNLQVYVGEFDELVSKYDLIEIHYKEHPLNGHYRGTETPREFIFNVTGYYPSFFAYWKKCKKQFLVK